MAPWPALVSILVYVYKHRRKLLLLVQRLAPHLRLSLRREWSMTGCPVSPGLAQVTTGF